ncbi:uncharacterized protein FIBRA_02128 [Fibroporia radiculosa]|uniref:Carrier domain-containing protein n=1 Tax=Fibroporia radiculosa TaxID=599839 RepID=J4I8W1_9APHY|nr:uncharacterized protein FIBRA_02128 [Fibroporia radiculosa]CCM00101.1 predicted protein [Fibroporia radiculosa]
MLSSKANLSDFIVFDSQGPPTIPGHSPQTIQTAIRDSRLPLGHVLLTACHQALVCDLTSVSQEEQTRFGLNLKNLGTPLDLLHLHPALRENVAMENVHLLLIQLLRFVANVEFPELLCEGRASGFRNVHGLLGSSTGLLAAVVVSTSKDIPAFIATSVEAFRLAFWLGFSTQCFIHSSGNEEQLLHVKANVMKHISGRNIRFPTFHDLVRPIRSSINGRPIDDTSVEPGVTLVEAIVDMVLRPVNLDIVVETLRTDFACHRQARYTPVRLINVGPGTFIWQSIIRVLQQVSISPVDWTSSIQHDVPTGIARAPSFYNQNTQEPIAIVGTAINFPGAKDMDALWSILENDVSSASQIPKYKFDIKQYMEVPEGSHRTLKTTFGNFLEDADVFDNAFFHISPREARSMDPQQRVLLHVAYHALEDAGYVPNATSTSNPDTFATYIGCSTNDYVQNLRKDVDIYYSTGTLQAFLCGKISHAFGFSGPSIVVDTACSSSIVAIYQACRALSNGDCNAALAGGVNVISSPDMYLGLERAHFLSQTGQCRPWDVSADGYCRAEGCGIFVLKRLSDALFENDRIQGVIRGVEVNQSGKSDSITHPHVETQARLLRNVLEASGVHPHEVSVVEAHGTGTQAGDPAEMESLRSVLAVGRLVENPLHVTSVKANIGHAEAASGAASLAKLVLMMQKHMIPATISLKQLNPKIPDLASDNVRINLTSTPWSAPTGNRKRIALLNNFGAAGSNAALVLEEPPLTRSSALCRASEAVLLCLSCESEEAIERLRVLYLTDLEQRVRTQSQLADFAYTATARRQLHKYRIAAVGTSIQELAHNLQAAGVVQIDETQDKVIFVFSGQGGQYHGMGAGLYAHIPYFRGIVDGCHQRLVTWGFLGILCVISPDASNIEESDSIEILQPATFVLQCALAKLWMSWGVLPHAVMGHSLGEYAALVIADVISLDDGLKLVAYRARLMNRKCQANATGMLSIQIDADELEQILCEDAYNGVSIACYNGTSTFTVGGDTMQLRSLRYHCEKLRHSCVHLDVPFAYHTAAMDPMLADLRDIGRHIRLSAPRIFVSSAVHGMIINPGDVAVFTPDYFVRHCRDPVRFQQCIENLVAREESSRIAAWIEIGPHPITLRLLPNETAAKHTVLRIASLRKHKPDEEVLCSALSKLYCLFTRISWRAVFADFAPDARLTTLPSYPFAQSRFWISYQEDPQVTIDAGSPSGLSFILPGPSFQISRDGFSREFDINVDQIVPFISGHEVAGYALCPASLHYELALASAHNFLADTQNLDTLMCPELLDVVHDNPLVYAPWRRQSIRVDIQSNAQSQRSSMQFKIYSLSIDSPISEYSYCSGKIRYQPIAQMESELSSFKRMLDRRRGSLQIGCNGATTFYTRGFYNKFSRVVSYSELYRTIKAITIRSDGADAYAIMECPRATLGRFVIHPIFMDSLLHAAGFVVNHNAAEEDIFICNQVNRVRALCDFGIPSAMYGVYCSVGFMSEAMTIVDIYATKLDGEEDQVVAYLEKVRFRKLKLSSFKRLLSASLREKHVSSTRSVVDAEKVVGRASCLESQFRNIIAEVCGVQSGRITRESLLGDLGVDSLMSIELVGRLRTILPSSSIESSVFMAKMQVGELIKALEDSLASGSQTDSPRLVSSSTSDQSFGRINKVREIISSVLGFSVQDLPCDQELSLLGMDSLSSIETRQALQLYFGIDIAYHDSLPRMTVEQISAALDGAPPYYVRELDSGSTTLSERNPALLQCGDPNVVPLFLIHDGSGLAHQYANLSRLDRRVWGIHNPKLPTGEEWEGGVIEMAAHYTNLISEEVHAAGKMSCIVGGWSFGGVVAFEVARHLVDSGIHVKGIVLIDSPHPLSQALMSDSFIDVVVGSTSRLASLVRAQMRAASKLFAEYDPSVSPASHAVLPTAVMLRCEDGCTHAMIQRDSTSFFADRTDRMESISGWERILGTAVPVLDIPGNHFEPFERKNVGVVSAKLKEALAMFDP